MKTTITLTLILMGGVLVMTPAISDYFFQRSVVTLLSHPGVQSVNLDGKMGDLYRIGCWLTGSGMIAVAVLCALFAGQKESESKALATHTA